MKKLALALAVCGALLCCPVLAADVRLAIAEASRPSSAKPAQSTDAAEQRPEQLHKDSMAFLDSLSGSVDSGDLFVQRRLTVEDMKRYANRTYRGSVMDLSMTTASD